MYKQVRKYKCEIIGHVRAIRFNKSRNKESSFCRTCYNDRNQQWLLVPENKIKRVLYYTNRVIKNKARLEMVGLPLEKQCVMCLKMKSPICFYRDDSARLGLSSECIDCNKMRSAWNQGHKFDVKKHFLSCSYKEYVSVVGVRKCSYCDYEGTVGADRIDNTKGHSIDNIIAACAVCNTTRNCMFSVEEMKLYFGPIIANIRKTRAITYRGKSDSKIAH